MYHEFTKRVYQLPLNGYIQDSEYERPTSPLCLEIMEDSKSRNGIATVIRKDDKKEFIFHCLPEKPEG